ncbi:hypothetical protein CcaCcLH18_02642 [Colletotrichum camelliae]|nr:hypothetical protein CcaCcLH18_02642 [Colletotrichum camelliae]
MDLRDMAPLFGRIFGRFNVMYLALPVWTELSYSYIADIRSAHNTQKQYLREISAPTEVLLRSEEVSQNLEKENLGFSRPDDLSKSVVTECAQKLDKLCTELRKPSPSIFWPIQEKNLKKHIEDLHRFRSSEDYTQWAAGSKLPLLWCYGPPGVGRLLAAVAIQDEAVWKDLLRQVVARGGPSTVQKLVNFRKELGIHRPASSKDFSDGLKIACADQQFVLVLEGSDEMETPGELKIILVPFTNASVLITSRDTPEIHSTLNQATAMEVQADANDMRAYVASRFEDCDLDDLVKRPPELEKEILEKSQGMAATSRFTDMGGRESYMPDIFLVDAPWNGTPLHLAAMAGSAEITRLLLEVGVDVNARIDYFDNVIEGYPYFRAPEEGPTALHIALRSWIRSDNGEDQVLNKGRLDIASMLIENGASVEGVADHLRLEHIAKFEDFPQLWDKLRVGITVAN